jgi:hypothetical protein
VSAKPLAVTTLFAPTCLFEKLADGEPPSPTVSPPTTPTSDAPPVPSVAVVEPS